MSQAILNQIRDSPKLKAYLLLAFLFVTILMFIRLSREKPAELEAPSKLSTMKSEEDSREPVVGGLGDESPGDEEVANAVNQVKPDLERRLNIKFESLDVLKFKRQVVSGINYFVKVKGKTFDGEEKILHLRIYKHFLGTVELTSYQVDKKIEDKIEHFE